MREAYLTGGTDADETVAPAEQSAPVFILESVTLTEEGCLKLVGARYFGETNERFTIERNRAPHPDLLKELRRLTLHMALLTESVSDDQLYPIALSFPLGPDFPASTYHGGLPIAVAVRNALREAVETGDAFVHPKLEPFRCLSVTWKTKGVVLSGERKSRYRFSKSLPIKTPETLLLGGMEDEDMEENDYPFFEHMGNTLASLQSECIAYMNGKYGEGGEQLHLFGKDPEVPTVAEAFEQLDEAVEHAKKRSARRVKGASDVF